MSIRANSLRMCLALPGAALLAAACWHPTTAPKALVGHGCYTVSYKLYDNRKEGPTAEASVAPMFEVTNPVCLVKLETVHKSSLVGQTPIRLGIVDETGKPLAPLWQAVPTPGPAGAATVVLSATPAEPLVLSAGQYRIVNSDARSWSHLTGSSREGLTTVWVADREQ